MCYMCNIAWNTYCKMLHLLIVLYKQQSHWSKKIIFYDGNILYHEYWLKSEQGKLQRSLCFPTQNEIQCSAENYCYTKI